MEEKPEDIERLKKIQLEIHQDFIEVVEESRKNKLNKNSGVELFSGEFWSGKKAKELGLIDEIGNINQVLKEKFGKDVVIKKFEKPKSWISKKLSSSEEKVEKIVADEIFLEMDSKFISSPIRTEEGPVVYEVNY